MKFRHYGAGMFMLVGLLLAGSALTRDAAAQDLDPYHAFVLDYLETNYNITGGDFLLGEDVNLKLDQAAYGTAVATRQPADPEIGFEYVHTETTIGQDPWSGGINWLSRLPITSGDTGLYFALVRGESDAGGPAIINHFVERAGGDFAKFGSDRNDVQLSSDWVPIIVPFTWPEDFAVGGVQFGIHLASQTQFVDVTAPVVLNYGDKYSAAVLEGLIASGGGTPTVADIDASTISGPPPLDVTFDASGSSSGGTITSYAWDFGDGTTGSGETVTHTFADQGTYTVSLTVDADDGESGMANQVITVTPLHGSLLDPLEARFAQTAPVIDGERDDVWDEAEWVTIENVATGIAQADENDLSGSAALLWDKTYLYVRYEITDEALFRNSQNSWEDDAVDFYVDPGNDKASSYDLTEDLQHEYSWDSTGVTGQGPMVGLPDGVYAFVTTATGYSIEAALPWDTLGVTAENNVLFGVEFMINDDDGTGVDAQGVNSGRQTKLAWFAYGDNSWQFPYLFGNAVLTGEIVASEQEELPGSFAIESVYPNPFNPATTLAVQLRELGDYTVRAFNVLGQKVLEETFTASAVGQNNVTLSFDNLPSGLYTISLQHKVSGKAVSTIAVLLK